jgi:hypothetical protein
MLIELPDETDCAVMRSGGCLRDKLCWDVCSESTYNCKGTQLRTDSIDALQALQNRPSQPKKTGPAEASKQTRAYNERGKAVGFSIHSL